MLPEPTKRLLDEIASLASDVNHEVVEPPSAPEWTMALFDRCRSAFDAIRILADQGFGHETLVLGRSLVTESLMLMELAAADDKRRFELLAGWTLAADQDLIGLFREARARGEVESAAIEEKLEAHRRRIGRGIRKWKVNEKELARRHEREHVYIAFRRMHHFVHNSAFAMAQRYSKEDGVARIGRAGSAKSAEPAAVFAGSSLLDALEAENTILGLPQPPRLEILRSLVEGLSEGLNLEAG